MAAESSFDIVCKLDGQEVKNAVQHSMKEIVNRFDFKGSGTEIQVVMTAPRSSSSPRKSSSFKARATCWNRS